ncbi:glycosyltransferase family 2 protein [Roseobacter sp. S98]|uniref:glycosyltransferase family 2 protein n=1 Tax=Roseobacter algicola (ex Choi et al. 2025) (nom. illeg.) TaxID=3092138 RepID=UPI003F513C5B
MTQLSWGLLIATKDRAEPLQTCVRLALAQTRPPVEIIVVDSSADWADHARTLQEIVADHPQIRFVCEQGAAPSLTVQRNQAIALGQADIFFMIDDDSFMHPDCAEEIMRLYEADTAQAVAGVQASETAEMPGVAQQGARRTDTADVSGVREKSALLRWVFRVLLMMGKKEVFIPYDRIFREGPVPAELQGLDAAPVALFGGFRMTYRRAAVTAEQFDPCLRYYCPGEDLDGSYRVSRQGILLTANAARLHHYVSAAGRLNRGQVAHLWSLNQAVLLRRHASDQVWARQAYRRRMAHRVVSDVIKDLLMRRFSLPQTRGSCRAWREAAQVFAMTPETLETWYPGHQERIIKGGTGT